MTTLKVYHLPGAWGLVSVSPFCLKLDSFLRITGIPHKAIRTGSPFGGPKKKAPWIEYNGTKMGDSTLIIDFLKQEFGKDPDAHLSVEQKAVGVAIQRLIEENLNWLMVFDRWTRDENWQILKATVLSDLPTPLRLILPPIARRSVKKQLVIQGIGRHSNAEIAAIAAKDIGALAALLGDQDWFHGSTISTTDATIFSLLANIALVEFHSPMKAMIADHANLTQWLKRFRAEVYPQH